MCGSPFHIGKLIDHVNITRWLPVRVLRSKGWRTRPVDHATERMLNDATRPSDRVRHDNIDVLVRVLMDSVSACTPARMWKRDISKAALSAAT